MTPPQPSGRRLPSLTRRRFLTGASAAAVGGGAVAAAITTEGGHDAVAATLPHVPLPSPRSGLPARQHAWTATLPVDGVGNPVAPRFDRLLLFDLAAPPTPAGARILEATLRSLEHAHPWGPSGLLFTVAYGHGYFTKTLRTAAPIPLARPLSDFELPAIDDYDVCLHLASDDERRLADVEAALVSGAPLPGTSANRVLPRVLRWRETRTGFTGAGLPAARQDVGGIPAGHPVPRTAPLYMGFASNLRRNQATEDDVTIPSGAFAEGTTMHVSYMRLRLDSWYGDLSRPERIARMYAPQVTPREQTGFTTDAESDPQDLDQAINRYGVIGHAQTSARARRNGRAIILRRDFDTDDGGQAGLHFVCLQRSIADFVTTRTAMNAASAQLQNPSIGDTVNNGINEFIFVLRRGNYIVPPRAARAFPLLPGRKRALA